MIWNQGSTTGAVGMRVKRNGLDMECRIDGRGKLIGKIERAGRMQAAHEYLFDGAGRLISAEKNGLEEERYVYNAAGQRVRQQRGGSGRSNHAAADLAYDAAGQLVRAGAARYAYDGAGSLRRKTNGQGTTVYAYEKGTRLSGVVLPDGSVLSYGYGEASPMCPVVRCKDGKVSAEYAWEGMRLKECRDYEQRLVFTFRYTLSGLDRLTVSRLDASRISSRSPGLTPEQRDRFARLPAGFDGDAFRRFFGEGERITLFCGCDQVGTLKLLTRADGSALKFVEYDSFGNVLYDSLSGLFIPVGFAGGLADRDTGLIRFGWRDYDPAVGRFTARDPMRDTRGDGDLYDYCVDDPVSNNDPGGLWWTPWDERRVPRKKNGQFDSLDGGESEGMRGYERLEQNREGNAKRIHDEAALRKSEKNYDRLDADRAESLEQRYEDARLRKNEADYDRLERDRMDSLKQRFSRPVKGQPIQEPWSDKTPFTAEDGSKREYYVIGARRLRNFSRRVGPFEHRHFIANDGTNIGRLADDDGGITFDSKEMWKDYVYYDSKKYRVDLIEEATRIYERQQRRKNDIASSFHIEDPRMDDMGQYVFFSQDCQNYVDDIINIAEDLARQRNMSLYIN